jgi:biotin transport system substrate-specific component
MSTLAMQVSPPRVRTRTAYRLALALAGSWLIAGLAQLEAHLPFTPVPVTGQTLGVLLVAASLGPRLGGASIALYLVQGAAGLPFFAGGTSGWDVLTLGSVTGGYLWGFAVAAAVVGSLAERGWDRDLRRAATAMLVGEVAIYAIAIPWLMVAADLPIGRAFALGMAPFLVGDLVKLVAAAALLPTAWRVAGRR